MRISDVLIRLIGASDPNCPNEADVLAYSEKRLPTNSRARIERHFADCHDCRQVLAFLGRVSDETPAALAEEAVSAQTDKVLAYIHTDERNRRKPVQKAQAAAGFYISYPKLAAVGLVICAIAIAGLFLLTRNQSASAMEALKFAVKDTRQIEPRVSGGFDHSRYEDRVTRGGVTATDDLYFSRAENKAKVAAQETAAAKDKLVLARVHLARGTDEDAKQALTILDQLTKSGIDTHEALNDTGVAYLLLGKYSEAITYFSKALAKSPAYGEALFNRALAEGLDRRNEDAQRDWQEFIERSSDDNWKNEAREKLNKLNNAIK
jgi:tetratricopeptide (TPR) repeat protein